MTEHIDALNWLTEILTDIATGGVWRGVAPEGTPTPFIVISLQGAADRGDVSGFRLMTEAVYLVKAVGPSRDYGDIIAVADDIDEALQRASGESVQFCYREQPIAIDEMVNGAKWSNIGGLYRIII